MRRSRKLGADALTGLDEGGVEGGDLVDLVDRHVRDGVHERNSVGLLLQVDMFDVVVLGRRVDVDGVAVEDEAGRDERARGLLGGRVGALSQRMVDTRLKRLTCRDVSKGD